VIADPLEALDGGTRREVAGPVGMRIAGVREKVVGLGWPCDVGVMQRLQVARRRRVEQIEKLSSFDFHFVRVSTKPR
jgi:hypothetical protein